MTLGRTVGRAWNLLEASARLAWQDREVLWLPLAAFALVAAFLVFWFDLQLVTLGLPLQPGPDQALVLFLLYLLESLLVLALLATMVSMAHLHLSGGDRDPGLGDGLSTVWSRGWALLLWAIVTAGVGLGLRQLREVVPQDRWLVPAAELAWAGFSYFVVPALVVREEGPLDAVRGAVRMIDDVGTEASVGRSLTTATAVVLAVPGVVAVAGALVVSVEAVQWALLLAGLSYLAVVAAAVASVQSYLAAALFHYDRTGHVPAGFERLYRGALA